MYAIFDLENARYIKPKTHIAHNKIRKNKALCSTSHPTISMKQRVKSNKSSSQKGELEFQFMIILGTV